MNPYLLFLIMALVGGVFGSIVVVLVGYKWGVFAAMQALAADSPKWKAYALAMIPPGAFSVAFHFDQSLAPFAFQTFCALATPAALGTFIRYNRGNHLSL